jgi:hypothetical protein
VPSGTATPMASVDAGCVTEYVFKRDGRPNEEGEAMGEAVVVRCRLNRWRTS